MTELGRIEAIATKPLHDSLLSGALQQNIKSPNRVLASRGCYASIAVGMPELVRQADIFDISRGGFVVYIHNLCSADFTLLDNAGDLNP